MVPKSINNDAPAHGKVIINCVKTVYKNLLGDVRV